MGGEPGLHGGTVCFAEVFEQRFGFLPRLGQGRVDGTLLVPARVEVSGQDAVEVGCSIRYSIYSFVDNYGPFENLSAMKVCSLLYSIC